MINAAQIHAQASNIFSQFSVLKAKVTGITVTADADDLDRRFVNIRQQLLNDDDTDVDDEEQSFSPRG